MDTCLNCGEETTEATCPNCGEVMVLDAAVAPSGADPISEIAQPETGADFFESIAEPPPPPPPPAPPRQKSKAWLFALGGLVIVLVGVGFFMRSALGLFVDTTNDTLDYVPANAQLYFAIDLVETARATADSRIGSLIDQIEQEFELENEGFADEVDSFEDELLDDLADELGVRELNLSFSDDIASWAGRHIGVWGRTSLDELAQPDDVAGCFLVEARSSNDADAALERIYGEVSEGDLVMTRSEIDGRIVYEWSEDVLVQAGRIDEVVALCAGEGAFDEVVAAHASGDTLAANESFEKLEAEADDWALLWFLDVDELMTELGQSQDVDPGGFLGDAVLFTGNLTDQGFTVQTVLDAPADGPVSANGLAAADMLPGDVYLAFGSEDLGTSIRSSLDTYLANPDFSAAIEEVFDGFRDATGVDLNDAIDSMEGPFGLAVSAATEIEEFPVGVIVFSGVNDRTPMDGLVEFVNNEAGIVPVEHQSGGLDVFVYDLDFLKVSMGLGDDRVVLAIPDELIDQMTGGDVLSVDPSFLAAVGHLPDGSGWIGHVDVTKIIDAVLLEAGDEIRDESDGADIVAALEIVRDRFPYIVGGVEVVDGLVKQTSVLVFTEEARPDA